MKTQSVTIHNLRAILKFLEDKQIKRQAWQKLYTPICLYEGIKITYNSTSGYELGIVVFEQELWGPVSKQELD